MFLLMSMLLVAQVLRQDKIIISKRWLGPRCSQQPYKYDNDNAYDDNDGDDGDDGNGDDDEGEDEKSRCWQSRDERVRERKWNVNLEMWGGGKNRYFFHPPVSYFLHFYLYFQRRKLKTNVQKVYISNVLHFQLLGVFNLLFPCYPKNIQESEFKSQFLAFSPYQLISH